MEESGVRYFMNHVKVLQKQGFPLNERKKYIPLIWKSIIESVEQLDDAMNEFDISYESKENEVKKISVYFTIPRN